MQRKHFRLCKSAGILAAAMLTVTGFSTAASAAAAGDVNGDGSVNKADVTTLLTWLTSGKGSPDRSASDLDGDGMITANDLTMLKRTVLYTEPDPVYIHLKDSGITYEGGRINVSGKTAEITASGVYYIDGSIKDGQVLVNIPDETADSGTVKLFLNGVSMTNGQAPCIMVENAEKTTVHLEPGKENSLSDGKEKPASEVEIDYAVLHAKDDLTVKGEGELNITAGIAHGIHCNNDLKLNGGSLNIETENGDAVRGRTSVKVKDGSIFINTEGDGIKSTKGSLEVSGGTVQIKSSKDALQSETEMMLTGGTVQACGDRGVKPGTDFTLDGCTLLATATDNPAELSGKSAQPALEASFVKEWAKNNPIALTDNSENIVFNLNTLKKYRYAFISSPDLKDSSAYQLWAGGIQVEKSGKNSFTPGSDYTSVNNTNHAKLLYSKLYDKTKVHKIEVLMDKAKWSEFLTHADEEIYYPCDVIVDGERINNVGIRTKGNSSRMFVSQGKSEKYSWRIKFDKYDKYQNYYGLTELCMNNMFSDPSCMRDRLCYDALEAIDGVGPNSAWTDMYLNGELFSFYFLAEQPGDTLAERLATSDDAVLYKATDKAGNNGGGMWGGGGNDGYCSFTEKMQLENFDVKFGSDDNFTHIDAIKKAINQLSTSNYKFIEDVIDVPSFLKGFAVNSVMCNYDSYNGTLAHNYYLMYNDGKAYFVGWDYNLSLGNFMDGGQSVTSDVKSSLYQVEVKDRPLAKLLQIPEYYDMYIGYVKTIVSMYENPEKVVNAYADLIRSHAKADPRSFFTSDKFDTNISKSATGLQVNTGGGGGGWGMFGGGMFGGGMFGGGGGVFTFGGENVSIVDFLYKRVEIIRGAI
ncbi:MAG: carbohydrate-binding domain-containing protein [Oscillospiraceae bacterium]|nr:carbohydrate-binding domain-containing protein [Oscillospiraceae bacterium]